MDTFNVSVMVKCECSDGMFFPNVQDEKRLKFYCMSVSPVNYAQEAKRLVGEIQQLMAPTSL